MAGSKRSRHWRTGMKTSPGSRRCQDVGQRVPGGRALMPRRQTRTAANMDRRTDKETINWDAGKIHVQLVLL